MTLDWLVYVLGVVAVVFLVSSIKSTIDMPINLKTHIQMQSRIIDNKLPRLQDNIE